MSDTELKVIDLYPSCSPFVDSLTVNIESAIDHYVASGNVTLSEVVGVLEIIKHEIIVEALKEQDAPS